MGYWYQDSINNLSSTTMYTNHSGGAAEDLTFYPWGDVWLSWGSGGFNFAELPFNDTKTNTNPTLFRFQSPNPGRWLSPDPLGGDITNPQSLNRYPYVLNNPTSNTDPLGLQPDCDPEVDPDCCDPSDPTCGYPSPYPPPIWGPGSGGGGGGRPPSAPPTPPLGGMGNAAFGGLLTCTQVTVVVGGISYPTGPKQCTLNAPPWLLALLQRPWMISWIIPMIGEPPLMGVGPAGSVAWNPPTHTLCVSAGAGASVGRNVALGPVTNAYTWGGVPASPSQTNGILGGWSVSGGGNIPSPAGGTGPGAQLAANGSGWLLNPNVGIPGLSGSVTNATCSQLW
jgi:RHS repeat-associated protein